MKKIFGVVLLTIVLLISISWIVLSNFEFGRYEDLQEAIEQGIPYEINNIIHTEHYDGLTIVMYTTDPKRAELPFANYEALAVAFFKGNDDRGWKNIGNNGWTHYENENMTVYVQPLRYYADKGMKLNEIYVVFGEINNPEIATVETKNEKEKSFKEAEMITKKGKRYYFHIGQDAIVRGLSKNGEVIDRQG